MTAGPQVALASAHGAPGVTTLVLGLGLVSGGGRPAVIGELDPWGGDLAPRLGLGCEPGLATLAAAGRRGLDAAMLVDHSQPLVDRVRLLAGRPGRAGSAQTVEVVAKELPVAARAAGLGGWWDVGRLDESSAAWPAVLACDVVVLVATATAAGVAHVLALAERLSGSGPVTVAVVVSAVGMGRRALHTTEVAAGLDGRAGIGAVLGRLPDDPVGVAMLERGATRWAGRSALGHAIRGIAAELAAIGESQGSPR